MIEISKMTPSCQLQRGVKHLALVSPIFQTFNIFLVGNTCLVDFLPGDQFKGTECTLNSENGLPTINCDSRL
jgi:hypothetical protein